MRWFSYGVFSLPAPGAPCQKRVWNRTFPFRVFILQRSIYICRHVNLCSRFSPFKMPVGWNTFTDFQNKADEKRLLKQALEKKFIAFKQVKYFIIYMKACLGPLSRSFMLLCVYGLFLWQCCSPDDGSLPGQDGSLTLKYYFGLTDLEPSFKSLASFKYNMVAYSLARLPLSSLMHGV